MADALPNLLPPLSTEEREALRSSMQEHGFWPTHPVIVDEEGNVIDGHNRKAVAEELGIDYPTVVAPGLTRWEKVALAIKSNIVRRQLDAHQRRAVVRTLEQEYDAELDRRARQAQDAGRQRGGDTTREKASVSRETQARAARTKAADATGTGGFNPDANDQTYARHAEKAETADKNSTYASMVGASRSTVARDRAVNRLEDEARAAGVDEERIQRALDAVATRRIGLLGARTQLGLVAGIEPNRTEYVNPTYGTSELASFFSLARTLIKLVPLLTSEHMDALLKSDINERQFFVALRALETKLAAARRAHPELADTEEDDDE